MAILKIAKLGHPILRRPAKEVGVDRMGSSDLLRLVEDMVATMREYDGVGLAAPQVHVPLRVVVIESAGSARYPEAPSIPLTVLVNPVIEEKFGPVEEDWEGCLSIPDLRGRVPRHNQVRVRAQQPGGGAVVTSARDFFARVIQHEVDHLDGILFIDRMSSLESLSYWAEWERFGRRGREGLH